MATMSGTRSDRMSQWTTVALVLAAFASLLGVLLRGDPGLALDWLALVLLGTLPALRVAVLAIRWARSGDHRYSAAAVGLLLLMCLGMVVVTVWR